MIEKIIGDAALRMDKSIESYKQELAKIRTGRAHPSLLDHISVDFYGTRTPLTQAANVSIEDARTLTVQPWDKTMVKPIEKAIMESDLGLNPMTAGTVIRIPIPPLSEERRKDLIKVLRAEAEQAKVAVRNIRRDAIHHLKDMVKAKDASEDEERRAEEQVQVHTDKHVKSIDKIFATKEQEMLEI